MLELITDNRFENLATLVHINFISTLKICVLKTGSDFCVRKWKFSPAAAQDGVGLRCSPRRALRPRRRTRRQRLLLWAAHRTRAQRLQALVEWQTSLLRSLLGLSSRTFVLSLFSPFAAASRVQQQKVCDPRRIKKEWTVSFRECHRRSQLGFCSCLSCLSPVCECQLKPRESSRAIFPAARFVTRRKMTSKSVDWIGYLAAALMALSCLQGRRSFTLSWLWQRVHSLNSTISFKETPF